jgi:hypothetical protein
MLPSRSQLQWQTCRQPAIRAVKEQAALRKRVISGRAPENTWPLYMRDVRYARCSPWRRTRNIEGARAVPDGQPESASENSLLDARSRLSRGEQARRVLRASC